MKAKIYVNRHIVRDNAKGLPYKDPISIRTSKGTTHASGVMLNGPSIMYYDANHCPRVWLETQYEWLNVSTYVKTGLQG